MKILKIIIILIILYFYVYSPPFIYFDINIGNLVFFPLLLLYILNKPVISFSFNKIKIIYFISIFYFLLKFIFGGDKDISVSFLIIFLITVPSGYFILKYLRLNGINLIDLLIINSLIASFITIFLFVFPDINNYLKFSIMKYDPELLMYQSARGFGIADELLYSYPIAQALIFHLCITGNYKFKYKIFCCLIIFISVFVNAKIGVIFIILSLTSQLFYLKKYFITIAFSIAAILILFNQIPNEIQDHINNNLETLIGEFNVSKLFESDASGSLSTLMHEMLFVPDDFFTLLFGDGTNIFFDKYKSSDSGFVIIIYYGGILLLLFLFYQLFLSCKIINKFNMKYYSTYLFIVFLCCLANIKGLFFAPKPGFKILCLIFLYWGFFENSKNHIKSSWSKYVPTKNTGEKLV